MYVQYLRDGVGAKPALQVTTDPHHGSLGAACVHTHLTPPSSDEKTTVPDGSASVRVIYSY